MLSTITTHCKSDQWICTIVMLPISSWDHMKAVNSFFFFLSRHIDTPLKYNDPCNFWNVVTVSVNMMVMGCDVDGTKWEQHETISTMLSVSTFIHFLLFQKQSNNTKCFTTPQNVFVQHTDSSSHFNAIWQKRIPCSCQYWETRCFLSRGCIVSEFFCSCCSLQHYFKVTHCLT